MAGTGRGIRWPHGPLPPCGQIQAGASDQLFVKLDIRSAGGGVEDSADSFVKAKEHGYCKRKKNNVMIIG